MLLRDAIKLLYIMGNVLSSVLGSINRDILASAALILIILF